MAIAKATTVHVEEYFCALCESRTGTSLKCCCPDDHEKLVYVPEERLRRRINLQADQKLCLNHAKKLRNGLLFGRSDWYECCSPFHVKSPRGSRLRPVPHSWKSYFESPSTNDRYRPRQRICWDCYLLAMEVINKDKGETMEDDEELSGYISPSSSDIGYVNPRKWANCISPQPGSPFGSQFGSTWSLTPSSHKAASIAGDVDDDTRSVKSAPKRRARFSNKLKARSLDYDLPSQKTTGDEKTFPRSDKESILHQLLEDPIAGADSTQSSQSKPDNMVYPALEVISDLSEDSHPSDAPSAPHTDESTGVNSPGTEQGCPIFHPVSPSCMSATSFFPSALTASMHQRMSHYQEYTPQKVIYVSKYAKIIHSDKKPSKAKEDTADDSDSPKDRKERKTSGSTFKNKETVRHLLEMKPGNPFATADTQDHKRDTAEFKCNDSINLPSPPAKVTSLPSIVVSENILKSSERRRPRAAKGLSFTDNMLSKNDAESQESGQTDRDVTNDHASEKTSVESLTGDKVDKDAYMTRSELNEEELKQLLRGQPGSGDQARTEIVETLNDHTMSTSTESDCEISGKHAEIGFDDILDKSISHDGTGIKYMPKGSAECADDGSKKETDDKLPVRPAAQKNGNSPEQTRDVPGGIQEQISGNHNSNIVDNTSSGDLLREECLHTSETGLGLSAQEDDHYGDVIRTSGDGSNPVLEICEESIAMDLESGYKKSQIQKSGNQKSRNHEDGNRESKRGNDNESRSANSKETDSSLKMISMLSISTAAELDAASAPILETDLGRMNHFSGENSDASSCPECGSAETNDYPLPGDSRFDSVLPPSAVADDHDQIETLDRNAHMTDDTVNETSPQSTGETYSLPPKASLVESARENPNLARHDSGNDALPPMCNVAWSKTRGPVLETDIDLVETMENTFEMKRSLTQERTAPAERASNETHEIATKSDAGAQELVLQMDVDVTNDVKNVNNGNLSSDDRKSLSVAERNLGLEVERSCNQDASDLINSKPVSVKKEGKSHRSLETTRYPSGEVLQQNKSYNNSHVFREQQTGLKHANNSRRKGGIVTRNVLEQEQATCFMLEDLGAENALNGNQISAMDTSPNPNLYNELHGSKANSEPPYANGCRENEATDTDLSLASQPALSNAPGLRSGNRASEDDRAQFLRRRMKSNRSKSLAPTAAEPMGIVPSSSNETDVPVIYANRRSLWKDKRRKFGVSFASEQRPPRIVLEESVPTAGKAKLVEVTLERTSITREERKPRVHFDLDEKDGEEIVESPSTLREEKHALNMEKRNNENHAGEAGDDLEPPPADEDEDVSAILSDVLANAITMKSFSELAQSFNTGSTALVALVILLLALVILFTFVAVFLFVL